MINSRLDHYGYKNEITEYLDKQYNSEEYKAKHYIYSNSRVDNKLIIRRPGSSIGNILISKDNKILEIIIPELRIFKDCKLDLEQFKGKDLDIIHMIHLI